MKITSSPKLFKGRFRSVCIVFALFLFQVGFAQDMRSVTGSVTSKDDGMPLPGVNIFVEDTNYAAVTDFDGNFTIIDAVTVRT